MLIYVKNIFFIIYTLNIKDGLIIQKSLKAEIKCISEG